MDLLVVGRAVVSCSTSEPRAGELDNRTFPEASWPIGARLLLQRFGECNHVF